MRSVFFLALALSWGLYAQTPIRLRVDATDAPRRVIHVQMTMPAKPGPMTLLYPEWIPGEQLTNPVGMVHGGFVAGVVDDACGLAVQSLLPSVRAFPTAHMDIDFLRGIRIGDAAQQVSSLLKALVFVVLIAFECLFALLVMSGRRAREALFASSLIGLYLLSCDRVRYHNNRYSLFLFSFLLAFAPCDRAFVFLRAPLAAADRLGPLFAQRLAQLQIKEGRFRNALATLDEIPLEGERVIGREMQAQVHYWRGRALMASGDRAGATSESALAHKLVVELQASLTAASRDRFAARVEFRRMLEEM